ncbi:MAG: twin-arginine translocase TatA/TatE family subunit [Planctomycetaceae bacterium]|nr:twin-arginine translocase TatA/TatE family subunit [Planctomycetaceae bacterium]
MISSIIFGFLGASGPLAYIILGVVAILLFGNRLPSVMRSLGRSVVEFKKGVAGIEDELDEAVRTADEKATAKSEGKTEV